MIINKRTEAGMVSEKAMAVRPQQKKMGPKCHYCGKLGHIKWNCFEFAQVEKKPGSSQRETRKVKSKQRCGEMKRQQSSGSENPALVMHHELTASVTRTDC